MHVFKISITTEIVGFIPIISFCCLVVSVVKVFIKNIHPNDFDRMLVFDICEWLFVLL